MITVAYVIGHLRTVGPNLQLLYLVRNLPPSLFRCVVVVAAVAPPVPTRVERRLRELGAVVRYMTGATKTVATAQAVHELRRLSRTNDSLIVHSFGFRADAISAASGIRPWIANVRNQLADNYVEMFGRTKGTVAATVNLSFLRRANRVIACGNSVAHHLTRLGVASVPIRNGIDIDEYRRLLADEHYTPPPRTSVRRYLTNGSTVPGKNVEFLARAFARFPSGTRELLIMGHVTAQLRDECSSYRNVNLLGHVEQPAALMSHVDAFVSASLHEGFPNAPLEALASGAQVLLSAIPPHEEMVSELQSDLGTTFLLSDGSLKNALHKLESLAGPDTRDRCARVAAIRFGATTMSQLYASEYAGLVL